MPRITSYIYSIALFALFFSDYRPLKGQANALDTLTAKQLHDLAIQYRNANTDSAFLLINLAIDKAKTTRDSVILVASYCLMGTIKANNQEVPIQQALIYLDSAEFVTNQNPNLIEPKARVFYMRALTFANRGDFYESNKHYQNCYQYCLQNQEKCLTFLNLSLVELAKNYFYLTDYKKTIKYGELAEKHYYELPQDKAESRFFKSNLASAYTVLGNAYSGLGNGEKTLEYYKKDYELSTELQLDYNIAVALTNLASVYLNANQLDSVEVYYSRALDIYNKYGVTPNIAAVLINLGVYYNKTKDYNKAKNYLFKGIALNETIKQYQYMLNGYKELTSIYKTLGDKDSALIALEKVLALKDTLANANTLELRERMEAEFDLNIKELRLNLLQKENENKDLEIQSQGQFLKLMIVASIIFIILLSLLAFYLQKTKRISAELEIKNAELEELNRRKNEILSIIGHDLRGAVANMLFLKSDDTKDLLTDEERLIFENSLRQSIQSGLMMLDNVLEWAKGFLLGDRTYGPVHVAPVAQLVVNQLEANADKKSIRLHVQSMDVSIHGDTLMLEILIRNMLANAIKFCKLNGEVKLYHTTTEGKVKIYIEDQGQGMSQEVIHYIQNKFPDKLYSTEGTSGERGTGLGLRFSIDFAKRMGASVSVDKSDENGTRLCITFLAA
jgi:signal transduction histidine kinase